MKLTQILIGIQARSTSKRLPEKCFAKLGDKMILEHVLAAANNCAVYFGRQFSKTNILVRVCLLIPQGDKIKKHFDSKVSIVEGPEDDVLTRYVKAASETRSDYIIRITADCPLLKGPIITHHIKAALANQYDFLSNAYNGLRTSADGFDCEIMSAKLLKHLDENAKEASDREHVTTLIKRERPEWAHFGVILDDLDLSDLKFSIDTKEDLASIQERYERKKRTQNEAIKIFGRQHVHMF